MDIEIRKLSVDLLDDWLDFFDNAAFCDGDEWPGCYCVCYHWDQALQDIKSLSCTKEDGPFNRKCAIDLIRSGKMQGYLAYHNGAVVGWCNTNDKQAYNGVVLPLPWEDSEKGKCIKAIVCFAIAPDYRGKHVASTLLDRICSDAAKDGYEYIEAYPFENNVKQAYHGPMSMYERNGFVECGQIKDWIIVRKRI